MPTVSRREDRVDIHKNAKLTPQMGAANEPLRLRIGKDPAVPSEVRPIVDGVQPDMPPYISRQYEELGASPKVEEPVEVVGL